MGLSLLKPSGWLVSPLAPLQPQRGTLNKGHMARTRPAKSKKGIETFLWKTRVGLQIVLLVLVRCCFFLGGGVGRQERGQKPSPKAMVKYRELASFLASLPAWFGASAEIQGL